MVNIGMLGKMLHLIPGTFYHEDMLATLYSILGVPAGYGPGIHTLGLSQHPSDIAN